MRKRLDPEKSPLKNPIREDTPLSIYVNKWHHRLYYEIGWFRCYWLEAVGLIFVVGLIFWRMNFEDKGNWTFDGNLEKYSVGALLIIFLLTRFHLAAIPSIVASYDTKGDIYDHYKLTLTPGKDLAQALIIHSFYKCAVPMAFLMTIESVFYFWAISTFPLTPETYLNIPFPLIAYLMLGMAMSGMSTVGFLIKNNITGIYLGTIVPIILMALAAGPGYIRDFFENFGMPVISFTGTHPVTFFLNPENRMAYSGAAMSRQGLTTQPGIDPSQILSMAIWLMLFSCVVWIGIWIYLKVRIPPPVHGINDLK